MGVPLLEVTVFHPHDVPGAQEGGADRLYLRGSATPEAVSPEPVLVSSVARETDLPVFVLLRLNDTWTSTGGASGCPASGPIVDTRRPRAASRGVDNASRSPF